MRFIGGVDEAGRGSMIGPLVVCGISVEESKLDSLKKLGVKDSKKLDPQQRERLFPKILEISDFTLVIKVDCQTIDKNVMQKRLNILEAKTMATIIKNMNVDIVYVDSCDVNPIRFYDNIVSNIPGKKPTIYSLHKAENINIVVAAASIIAKVLRDEEIRKINEKYNNAVGSGYPSDKKSIDFVTNLVGNSKDIPNFIRKSWKPVKIIAEKNSSHYTAITDYLSSNVQ